MTHQNQNQQDPNEAFLDAAIAEALGDMSAAAPATTQEQKRQRREIQETVSRMSAAAPYMQPRASLKEQILAATAPATFKIEDYRRGERSLKFFRMGLAAAVMALVATGFIAYQQYERGNAYMRQATNYQQQSSAQGQAIAKLVNNNVTKIALTDAKGQTVGLLLQDKSTKDAMIVMPQDMIPPGQLAKVEIVQNGQRQTIMATPVGADGVSIVKNSIGTQIDGTLPVEVTTNDKVTVAGQRIGQ